MTLMVIQGDFDAEAANAMTRISMPALTTTTGDFKFEACDSLAELDVPALTAVLGGLFRAKDNPLLPTCQAQAVVDRLNANGFAGAIDVTGNSPSCP